MGKNTNYDPHLLLTTCHNYVVLDIETTGLKTEVDDITEIAMLKVRNDQVIDEYQRLIHPKKRIPREITMLTHITNSMVRNEPYFEEILEEIKAFIGEDVILGHKISVDLTFLKKYDPVFFEKDYLDTLRYARKAFPYLISCSLSSLVEEFDLCKNSHRALDDVYATKELYDYILEKRGGIETIYTRNPYLDPADQKIVDQIDIPVNNPFEKQNCILSGYLSKFSKSTAEAIIEKLGGKCYENVNQEITILILGEHKKDLPTKKHAKVLERIKNGQKIEIMDEETFYKLIGQK